MACGPGKNCGSTSPTEATFQSRRPRPSGSRRASEHRLQLLRVLERDGRSVSGVVDLGRGNAHLGAGHFLLHRQHGRPAGRAETESWSVPFRMRSFLLGRTAPSGTSADTSCRRDAPGRCWPRRGHRHALGCLPAGSARKSTLTCGASRSSQVSLTGSKTLSLRMPLLPLLSWPPMPSGHRRARRSLRRRCCSAAPSSRRRRSRPWSGRCPLW